MLKLFLFAIFATVSFGTASTNNLQFLPYNPQWGASFGNLANLANVMDESDGQGMLLPSQLGAGQYVAFPGESDFAQVYGPGTNPVFQTGDMDVPAQIVNGQLIPVPKPDQDNSLYDIAPQFWNSPGYPSVFNPITTPTGLVPAAPAVTGQTQQYPLFVSDNLGDLYKFQGYACAFGDCGDYGDIMQAQALANLLNPTASTATSTASSNTAATDASTAATTGTDASTSTDATSSGTTDSSTSTSTGSETATSPSTPAAPAATGLTMQQLMMLMGGQNPLNDEDTQYLPGAQNFLKTLPGGNLISMYGKVGDSVYGESDAFIPGPNGQPIFNVDNIDRRLQKTAPAQQQASKKINPLEDPFFWAFCITSVMLLSGISVYCLRKRRATGLEDVLMDSNYSSHAQKV